MQALLINSTGGPEVIQKSQVPIPTLGPNQVLVKVAYGGINYIDTYFRYAYTQIHAPSHLARLNSNSSTSADIVSAVDIDCPTAHRSGLYPVEFPFVLGQESAGTIVELGPSVSSSSSNLKKGDRVVAYVGRSYAEYVAVDAEKVYVSVHRSGSTVRGARQKQEAISIWGMTDLSGLDWLFQSANAVFHPSRLEA